MPKLFSTEIVNNTELFVASPKKIYAINNYLTQTRQPFSNVRDNILTNLIFDELMCVAGYYHRHYDI